MGNAADTIVSKYPTRTAQLRGPVLQYLMMVSKNLKFNGTDQDLYMAVFYPAYRRQPVNKQLPSDVRRANPGMNTAGDYLAKVNNQKNYTKLTDKEWTALKDTARKLELSWESLFKLISFESGWDPKARNKRSGARGLIQFMPSTAKYMGYKGSMGLFTILAIAGAGYYLAKHRKLL